MPANGTAAEAICNIGSRGLDALKPFSKNWIAGQSFLIESLAPVTIESPHRFKISNP